MVLYPNAEVIITEQLRLEGNAKEKRKLSKSIFLILFLLILRH